MKKFTKYPKHYVKASSATAELQELDEPITDMLETYQYDIGGPIDSKTIDYMTNNITFRIEDYGEDSWTELAEKYEGSAELNSFIRSKCRELGIGLV